MTNVFRQQNTPNHVQLKCLEVEMRKITSFSYLCSSFLAGRKIKFTILKAKRQEERHDSRFQQL